MPSAEENRDRRPMIRRPFGELTIQHWAKERRRRADEALAALDGMRHEWRRSIFGERCSHCWSRRAVTQTATCWVRVGGFV